MTKKRNVLTKLSNSKADAKVKAPSRPIISQEGYKQGPPPEGSHYRILGKGNQTSIYNPTRFTLNLKGPNGTEATIGPWDKKVKTFDEPYMDEFIADFREADLTEEEIRQYRKGGYVVEELPKAAAGMNVRPLPVPPPDLIKDSIAIQNAFKKAEPLKRQYLTTDKKNGKANILLVNKYVNTILSNPDLQAARSRLSKINREDPLANYMVPIDAYDPRHPTWSVSGDFTFKPFRVPPPSPSPVFSPRTSGPTDSAELAAIMAAYDKPFLISPGMMYYPSLGYAKPVQSKPEVGKLPIKKLTQTPEIIPSNYNYTPQEPETIRTASRSQTVMEPDPNMPGKFKVKDIKSVPYSANFPEEGWLPMNAPQVMYYNPTTGEETEKRFQNGGLAKAQNGIQSQASNAPIDSELTYGEYYAQAADTSKKSYDDYIIALEKEKQRVANVRKNVIPTAKKLDAADNEMRTDKWFNSSEGKAYLDYTKAENPKELETARRALSTTVKDLLPNQGKYNVARWDADENDWNPQANPNRELYCTPYGCFTYQKAGANDVPIIGGNLDFVQKVNSEALPFEKIPANQRQPGDVALWVENSPADYTDPSKGRIRRPHHTTIYATPDADEPNNPEAGNYYNANNGLRLSYGLTNYETAIEPLDRMDYYRYIGQTKKMEDELIKKQAAWEAAENKADRGPRPTLATVALDRSYFNTERPQEDIVQVDYNQQMIDRIANMNISDKKKRKLLKDAENTIAFNQKFQQPKSPILETSNVPTVNTQNNQTASFKKGGLTQAQLGLITSPFNLPADVKHPMQVSPNKPTVKRTGRTYDALTDVKPAVAESTTPKNLPAKNLSTNEAMALKVAERDATIKAIKEAPLLTEDQKNEILMDSRKLDEYAYLANLEDPGTITQKVDQTWQSRLKDIALNPDAALYYANSDRDMPSNYQAMVEAGIDPMSGERGGNAVLSALNTLNPLVTINDINKAAGQGNYSEAGLGLLGFIPGVKQLRATKKLINAIDNVNDATKGTNYIWKNVNKNVIGELPGGITKQHIADVMETKISWIESPEYARRRMATTGETLGQVSKDVQKLKERFSKTKIKFKPINESEWGYGYYQTAPLMKDMIVVDPNRVTSLDDMLGTLDHEIDHALSPAQKNEKLYNNYPFMPTLAGDYRRTKVKENPQSFLNKFMKGDKSLDVPYLELVPEQQVRFNRLNQKVREDLGLTRNQGELTEEQFNEWADKQNKDKFKSLEKGHFDVKDLISNKSTTINRSDILKLLNKAWVAIPTVGAATLLNPWKQEPNQKKLGGSVELELTDKEIQWYIDNGYTVENLNKK